MLCQSSSRHPIPRHSGPELTKLPAFFAYSDNYFKLSPADLADVETMLGGERPYAADARQFVKGRGSFSERFPEAARIKTAM